MRASSWILSTLHLLQVGLAAFVLVATAVHLQGITWESVDSEIVTTVQNAQCLLGKDANSSSLCTYTYIVAGASIAASILLSVLLCISCNCCGRGCAGLVDSILAGVAVAWWAIAGAVLTRYGVPANKDGWPQQVIHSSVSLTQDGITSYALDCLSANRCAPVTVSITSASTIAGWREAVFISAWVEAGLFAATILFTMTKCCGPREEKIEGAGKSFKRMKEEETARTAQLAAQRSRYGQFQSNPRPYSTAV